MAKENTITKETTIFDGILKNAYTHTEKNDDGTVKSATHILSIFNDENLSQDGADQATTWKFFDAFYEGKPAKYVPNWVKEKKDIVFKSAYKVYVKVEATGERMTFDEFVDRGLIRGAKVRLKCNVKDAACYPSALLVLEDGEEYDAFADF